MPAIKSALQAYADAGLFAASFDEDLGGMQIPALIHTASTALTMAANIATAAYPMLAVANARLLVTFGSGSRSTFRPAEIDGRLVRHHVPLGATSRFVARRYRDAGRG